MQGKQNMIWLDSQKGIHKYLKALRNTLYWNQVFEMDF